MSPTELLKVYYLLRTLYASINHQSLISKFWWKAAAALINQTDWTLNVVLQLFSSSSLSSNFTRRIQSNTLLGLGIDQDNTPGNSNFHPFPTSFFAALSSSRFDISEMWSCGAKCCQNECPVHSYCKSVPISHPSGI